jgi:hypothetical protein
MSECIYIHETIRISVEHRKAYLDHFTDVWGVRTRELYGLTCFGVWATVGSTGRWPESIVMWELEDHHHLTRMLDGEFEFLARTDSPIKGQFEEMWSTAMRGVDPTDGVDRLLAATPRSSSLRELITAGTRGKAYYHEIVSTKPGAVAEYLERYDDEFRPVAEDHGLVFVGAYRTMFRNDSEAVALWALPTWGLWEQLDTGLRDDPRVAAFRVHTADLGVDWTGKLLSGAGRNPLDTGVPL